MIGATIALIVAMRVIYQSNWFSKDRVAFPRVNCKTMPLLFYTCAYSRKHTHPRLANGITCSSLQKPITGVCSRNAGRANASDSVCVLLSRFDRGHRARARDLGWKLSPKANGHLPSSQHSLAFLHLDIFFKIEPNFFFNCCEHLFVLLEKRITVG